MSKAEFAWGQYLWNIIRVIMGLWFMGTQFMTRMQWIVSL